jgi:hypothetical protein
MASIKLSHSGAVEGAIADARSGMTKQGLYSVDATAAEGTLSRDQLKQHKPRGEYVGRRREGFSTSLLRRHVEERAGKQPAGGDVLRGGQVV